MTRPVDAAAIRRFLEAISRQAGGPTTVYLVGGSTAVMVDRDLVRPARLLELLTSIEANLYRFPAVDPESLRAAVTELVARRG